MNRIPVILDVDTGLDDVLAILLASDCPQLELLGIACVSGNAPVENTYTNTRYIAKQLGLKIPVAKGAVYPLANKVLHAQEIRGSSGLGKLRIETEYEKHILLASQLYEKILTETQEPVTIIATGPLTNLAHLIQNHPALKAKIRSISFAGGSLGRGNVTPYAEFNARFDPEALDIVLHSKISLIMAGFELTTTIRIDSSDLTPPITDPLPLQQLYLDLLDTFIENAKKKGYPQGAALSDSLAVAAVAMPEAFTSALKSIAVDTSKEEKRGETREEGEVQNVNVLMSAQAETMIRVTVDSIRHIRRSE